MHSYIYCLFLMHIYNYNCIPESNLGLQFTLLPINLDNILEQTMDWFVSIIYIFFNFQEYFEPCACQDVAALPSLYSEQPPNYHEAQFDGLSPITGFRRFSKQHPPLFQSDDSASILSLPANGDHEYWRTFLWI